MDSDPRDLEVVAYLTDERVPAGERGGLMLGLVAHAFAVSPRPHRSSLGLAAPTD